MIRTLTHKLIYRPDGESEFYDLVKDPRELKNAYGDAAYQKQQAELLGRMTEWYVRTADVAPKRHDPRNLPGAEH